MSKDELGNRMKEYEGREAGRKFMPLLPIIARIDGRGFSKFTKPFDKPFDTRLASAMRSTTAALVDKTHATIGYTQSDEITLIFYSPVYSSQTFFAGRVQKLTSVLAGMTSSLFLGNLLKNVGDDMGADILTRFPHFDCRTWQVPDVVEATNTLLWRAMDARKNGISSACRSMNSAKSMHKKNQSDMLGMIADKGVDYHSTYDLADRFGSYFMRETYQTLLDDETWAKIPDKQKSEMTRVVTRSRVEQKHWGYLGDYSNRVDMIFDHANPVMLN